MKDVQCYELFGGIALKNHAFSFFISPGDTQNPTSTVDAGVSSRVRSVWTDTTVLNQVISLTPRVARFISSLYQPYDVHEIRLS